jgi:hypothetical protein
MNLVFSLLFWLTILELSICNKQLNNFVGLFFDALETYDCGIPFNRGVNECRTKAITGVNNSNNFDLICCAAREAVNCVRNKALTKLFRCGEEIRYRVEGVIRGEEELLESKNCNSGSKADIGFLNISSVVLLIFLQFIQEKTQIYFAIKNLIDS